MPEERAIAEAIDRLRAGLAPEDLWAATFLAGIEDVEPRPVGFKFHCVMVMQPLWQVAQSLPERERVLPLVFGAWDFKQSQADDARGGKWTLPSPKESELPPAEKARAQLLEACETWDVEAADAAVTVMARAAHGAPHDEIVQALLPYGMRNWANIGHHAIFMACAFRVLDVIGWRHAEPVLRSLVHGLFAPGLSDAARPFEVSKAAAERLEIGRKGGGEEPPSLHDELFPSRSRADGGVDPSIRVSRAAVSPSPEAAVAAAARLLERAPAGVGEGLLWRDLHDVGLELMMETPGLLAVHATTGIVALRDLAERAKDPHWRRVAALQAAAWCSLWRTRLGGRGEARDSSMAALIEAARGLSSAAGADGSRGRASGMDSVDSFLADLGTGKGRELAVRIARGVDSEEARRSFVDGARRLLVAKGRETHDYKFFAALERISAVEPRLAAGSFYLRGPGDSDFGPVAEARAALLPS